MTKLNVYLAGGVALLMAGCVPMNPNRPTTDELTATATAEPGTITAGTAASLSATASGGVSPYVFRWDLNDGPSSVEFVDDTAAATETEPISIPGSYQFRVVATDAAGETGIGFVEVEVEVAEEDLTPRVLIEVRFDGDPELKEMILELDAEAAPATTANFLLYVDEGYYDGQIFHRAACASTSAPGECDRFVLQGGGVAVVDGELTLQEPTRDPVESEAGNGLSNATLNSVAMALTAAGPDSGTTQFFFNLADNSFLDDQQFTVFGQLVEGSEVIDAIFELERTTSEFAPPGEVSLPVPHVIMERVSRVEP